jgi:hypothetical protein
MVKSSGICFVAPHFNIKMAASGQVWAWLAFVWAIWQIKFNDLTPISDWYLTS